MFVRAIPSFITALNLSCGLLAILQNHPIYSSLCLLVGAICDVFDGAIARWLGVKSDFGKELDSLADAVSFGIAPAFLLYHHIFAYSSFSPYISTVACVILAVFACLRLAKFNVDTRQSEEFIGLPTPAMAVFFIGMIAAYHYDNSWLTEKSIMRILLITPFFFAALMVSPLKMFSFKKIDMFGISLMISSVFLLYFLHWAGLSIIIILYIILSCIRTILHSFKTTIHS